VSWNYSIEEMKVMFSSSVDIKIWLRALKLSWKKCITIRQQQQKQNKRVIAEISCVPTARTYTSTHDTHGERQQNNARFVLHLSAKQWTLSANHLSTHQNTQRTAGSLLSALRSHFVAVVRSLALVLCLYLVRFHFVLILQLNELVNVFILFRKKV